MKEETFKEFDKIKKELQKANSFIVSIYKISGNSTDYDLKKINGICNEFLKIPLSIKNYTQELDEQQETIDLQRQVIENILNDVATYCWQNQANYIDPQELSYWVEEKRKEIKPLLEKLGMGV